MKAHDRRIVRSIDSSPEANHFVVDIVYGERCRQLRDTRPQFCKSAHSSLQ